MFEKYIDRQAEYNSQFETVRPARKWLNLTAFLCGDISVTMYVLFTGMMNDLMLFGAKLITTLIIGAAGGIAGMAGKELYPVLKTFFKKKFKKTTKNE
jgi:hypothetical protein